MVCVPKEPGAVASAGQDRCRGECVGPQVGLGHRRLRCVVDKIPKVARSQVDVLMGVLECCTITLVSPRFFFCFLSCT